MEISASFRSLDALRQMSNIELNICAGINKVGEGCSNGNGSGLKEQLRSDTSRPLNFTTPV